MIITQSNGQVAKFNTQKNNQETIGFLCVWLSYLYAYLVWLFIHVLNILRASFDISVRPYCQPADNTALRRNLKKEEKEEEEKKKALEEDNCTKAICAYISKWDRSCLSIV